MYLVQFVNWLMYTVGVHLRFRLFSSPRYYFVYSDRESYVPVELCVPSTVYVYWLKYTGACGRFADFLQPLQLFLALVSM